LSTLLILPLYLQPRVLVHVHSRSRPGWDPSVWTVDPDDSTPTSCINDNLTP
jgi:hypothetical protein